MTLSVVHWETGNLVACCSVQTYFLMIFRAGVFSKSMTVGFGSVLEFGRKVMFLGWSTISIQGLFYIQKHV